MGIMDNPHYTGLSIPVQQKANYKSSRRITIMIVVAYLIAIVGTLMSGVWVGLALVLDALLLMLHVVVMRISEPLDVRMKG